MKNFSDDMLIEQTSDGSSTLFIPSLNEHYHSVNGAKQESQHIYIQYGLLSLQKNELRVLEIGFGTGLNAYLTYQNAELSKKKIDYTGIELYPLGSETIDKLNYASKDSDEHKIIYKKLHQINWNETIRFSDFFTLTKYHSDFTKLNLSFTDKFDVIYFDAFAPDKQPEMWSQKIFDFLYQNIKDQGVLTTYCAKGVVRRMLIQAGFSVERLPGPPGKREILRATRL